MKKPILISAIAFLFFANSKAVAQCCSHPQNKAAKEQTSTNGDTKIVTLKITGMTCAGCSNTVTAALSKKAGILNTDLKYPGDVATIKYDPTKITVEEIIATIVKAGYKAEEVKSDGKS
jgi:copper chaperone CopZ